MRITVSIVLLLIASLNIEAQEKRARDLGIPLDGITY